MGKNIYYANSKQKTAGVAMLISDKQTLRHKIVTRDTRHFIVIKGSKCEKYITIRNIYVYLTTKS